MYTFQVYKDMHGEYRWRLIAQNGKIFATSGEGYTSSYGAKVALQLVRAVAPSARVIDLNF